MKIAGIVKNSFVDYPGKLATVIFTPGCNMKCWYCHNAGIKEDENWNLQKVLDFIEERKDFLDGVVFTGGEVTLQPGLEDVMKKIKNMGLLVKLDTNGLNPEIVQKLIDEKLVDYIAMDIKAPFDKYDKITGVTTDITSIRNSIEQIMHSGLDYEFRTTFSPDLTQLDIIEIAKSIQGAKLFAIQQYRTECYSGMLSAMPHEEKYVVGAMDVAKPFVQNCIVRGLKHDINSLL